MTVDEFGYMQCPTCNGEHHVEDTAAWERCTNEEEAMGHENKCDRCARGECRDFCIGRCSCHSARHQHVELSTVKTERSK